jgi:threonine/homoserine/homoserine lactone efflux protein
LVQAALIGALFSLAAFPSGLVWLAFGATIQRGLHGGRRLRIFNIAMGVLLALSSSSSCGRPRSSRMD